VTDELKSMGVDSIAPGMAYRIIDAAIQSGLPQLAVIPESGEVSKAATIDPLLSRRSRAPESAILRSSVAASRTSDIRQVVENLPAEERVTFLEKIVTELTVDMMDVDPSKLGSEQSFGDLGMDSLLGLEFRKIIQEKCGVLVSPTLVWSFPTIGAVARHLARTIAGEHDTQVDDTATFKTSQASVEAIQDITDDEALRLLRDRG
jgi:acyl carrier protein